VKKTNNRWFVWIGLALMLLAIFGYVMSLDESDPDLIPTVVESEGR
jgi:LPXTG-motif cell wall-anchored protein